MRARSGVRGGEELLVCESEGRVERSGMTVREGGRERIVEVEARGRQCERGEKVRHPRRSEGVLEAAGFRE